MTDFATLLSGIAAGSIVPYLGPGALAGVVEEGGDSPIPADSDSLILSLNGGKPMAPRLMYEFPRAAMDLELKKGRSFVNRHLSELYGTRKWTTSPLHTLLADIKPGYVIDINRDLQLQQAYADRPHILVRGIARVGGTDYRYVIHAYDGESYTEILNEEVDATLPILFKPMGSPLPDATFIASDADYVDYITELMGGFAIPGFLKEKRKDKQYLFIGLRMTRDTERMVLSDIIYAHGEPTGWALIAEPTEKERRFASKMGIDIIEADAGALLAATEKAA